MRRVTTPLLAVTLLSALLLAACASTAPATPSNGQPTGERIYLATGATGAEIVGFAAQAPGGARVTLPAGLPSPDHRLLYVTSTNGLQTTIQVRDTSKGMTLRSLTIPGIYTTTQPGFADAVLSADGAWLALRDTRQGQPETTLVLLRTDPLATVKTIRLAGAFELDAIGPGGELLYLLQWLGDAAHHYYVRAYNVGASLLLDSIIADKTRAQDPRMLGSAVARQVRTDGSTAYTLYVDPATNIAFVHVLPLSNAANLAAVALCINLPVMAVGTQAVGGGWGAGTAVRPLAYSPAGGGAPSRKQLADWLVAYALALSADQQTLYAVNAPLGLAVKIALGSSPLEAQIVTQGPYTTTPAPVNGPLTVWQAERQVALSPDGATLYLAATDGLHTLPTSTLKAGRTYLAGTDLTSVALGTGGQVAYITDAAHRVLRLSLPAGQTSTLTNAPSAAPQGIAWLLR